MEDIFQKEEIIKLKEEIIKLKEEIIRQKEEIIKLKEEQIRQKEEILEERRRKDIIEKEKLPFFVKPEPIPPKKEREPEQIRQKEEILEERRRKDIIEKEKLPFFVKPEPIPPKKEREPEEKIIKHIPEKKEPSPKPVKLTHLFIFKDITYTVLYSKGKTYIASRKGPIPIRLLKDDVNRAVEEVKIELLMDYPNALEILNFEYVVQKTIDTTKPTWE